MYFNRQGSQQKNWRMFKKGKQILFACSLLLTTGLSLAAPLAVQATPIAESSEIGSSTDATMFRIRYRETAVFPGAQGSVLAQGRYGIPEPVRFSLSEGDSSVFIVEEKTGTVRYRVPSTVQDGEVLEAQVTVRYADQSTATVPLRLTVRLRLADKHRPIYAEKTVPRGTQSTILTVENGSGEDFPGGTSFAVSSQPQANGVRMTVDAVTGEITATISEDAVIGQRYVGIVKVTYSDRSQDTVFPVVIVKSRTADSYNPSYTTMTSPVVTGNLYTRDLATGGQILPEGTRFEMAQDSHEVLKVNPATGQLTFTTPLTSQTGDILSGVVKVIYPDQSVDEIPVSFTVKLADSQQHSPAYEALVGDKGATRAIPLTNNGQAFPEGTRFEQANPVNDAIVIDGVTGQATITVPADVAGGTVLSTLVRVIYPDNSIGSALVKVTVKKSHAETYLVSYSETGDHPSGISLEKPVHTSGQTLPDGTVFSLEEGGHPAITAVDSQTGKVTIVIPEDAQNGDVIEGNVRVTFPDDSSAVLPVRVTAKAADSRVHIPSYEETSTDRGTTIQIPITNNGQSFPEGTRFEQIDPVNEAISIDSATGQATVAVPADVAGGTELTTRVRVIYPDFTMGTAIVRVTVKVKDFEIFEPRYEEQSDKLAGTSVILPIDTGGLVLPDGVGFVMEAGSHEAISVDEMTGAVTVALPADAQTGTVFSGTVIITYPDGTTDKAAVQVTARAKPVEVPKPQPLSTISMYRLYDQKTNLHFYTSSASEITLLQARGWRLEGTAWKSPVSKEGAPVYRVWNLKTGERLYTRHQSEADKLVARGWKNEGIAFFTQDKGQPIYRVRNKKTGKYLLTVHLEEVQKLEASTQWKNEGIAFYGVR